MKAKSTIQKQIRTLRRIAEDEAETEKRRDQAYMAYHALRWVIKDVDWTPVTIVWEKP